MSCAKAIKDYLNIPIDQDKDKIKSSIITNFEDDNIVKLLRVFTKNVPYRFLSPWIKVSDDKEMELRSRCYENNCLYAIYDKEIHVNPNWKQYLIDHYSILKDYTFWNLNIFLQKRNPNVPDLSSKLIRPIQRESLTKQRILWNLFIQNNNGIECIYTHALITNNEYDLDHFIPWSFVAHNQMWNLLPANPSINSSKSNLLPPLDLYLKSFTQTQQEFLKYVFANKPNERLLEDYLQISDSISDLVYLSDVDFTAAFSKVFSPLEQIASNMGFCYMK